MDALRTTDPARIGAHTLLARLGAGGMGQVYLGRSPGGRLVAIKVIREEITGHPDALARFRREAETVRAVRSAYTANLIDASLAAPPYWLATEYVSGPTLADAVAGRGPLPPRTCLMLLAALAEGLASVHGYGVTHRDLKPQNVILSAQGPQLIDFGIAKGTAQTALTEAGLAPGTPGYTAPEVLLRGEAAAAADVFALGATLAYAATGRAPFGTGEAAQVSFRAVHGEIDLAGVEPALAALVEACTAKDPAERPSPAEVIERCAVDAALVDDPGYAALLAGAEPEPLPGLPARPGGDPAYVPTYTPAGHVPAGYGPPPAPHHPPTQGAGAPGTTQTPAPVRRGAGRWVAAVAAGLVAGILPVALYLYFNGDGGEDGGGSKDRADKGSPGASPAPGKATPGGSSASGGGAVPGYIEATAPSRDYWSGSSPSDGECNLPSEERALFLASSVTDADDPEAKSVTGKAAISVHLKPYHTEKTPYLVSVVVKPPHEIDSTTGRPFEGFRMENKSLGYTSRPVDLDVLSKKSESLKLTYPDDFAEHVTDNSGKYKVLPAVPVGNDPGDWTVQVLHVQGVKEYHSIQCMGFPVK